MILAQADPGEGEKVVVGPIDLAALRHERERRVGHDMRGHLRSEIHSYLDASRLPAAAPGSHPLTGDAVRQRISEGKRRSGSPT